MKEKKFFELAQYIDKDLIGEAAEYTPSADTQKQAQEETVYVSAVRIKGRKRQIWKYSAAVLALLAVTVGVIFANSLKKDGSYELPGETADTAATGAVTSTADTAATDAVTSTTDMAAAITDTTKAPDNNIDNGADFSALDLLGMFINENETEIRSRYCIDTSKWEELDDYELFREIFFGNWGYGTMTYGDMGEMEIDDSRVCHLFFHGYRFLGFYRISENVYGFKITDMVGFNLLWIDRTRPNTIYREVFMTNVDTHYSFPYRNDITNYQTPYAIKINNDIYDPDNGFMSVFKLKEMAKKYGIDYSAIVNIHMSNSDASVAVAHDDVYSFHEMYLISESDDKIVLETLLSDTWMKSDMLIPVVCTFEKKDGKWMKNVEVKDLGLEYRGD